MRRVTSLAWSLSGALVALVLGSCSDGPTESTTSPTAAVPAHIPVALATASTSSGAQFTTDKDDYLPGDTLKLAGTGWQPGDSLDIHLDEDPQNHLPVDWMVGVDESGGFQDSSYIVQESDLGVTFALTATSRATGETATAAFTDGQPTNVALTPTSRSIVPGGSAAYDVAVTMGGNSNACTVTLEVTTALPSGASAAFSGGSNPVVLPNGSGSTNFTRTVTITTTGAISTASYSFTVRATRGSGCQGSGTGPTATGTLIVLGPATKLAFGQQPTSALGGVTISPAVTAQVLDANNNVDVNSSASITLAIGANPGSGTLSGTLTQSAVNGVATFSGLSVDKIGTGYTLTAGSSGLTGATSSTFNITLGPASQVIFTTQPSGATATNGFTTQPVAAVTDAGGNPRTSGLGSGSTITLSIVSGTGAAGAVLTCGTNPLAASAGVASFAGCSINLAGTGYQLRASTVVSGNTFTATSSAFDVTAVDNAAPTIDCTVPNQAIWHDADVTVHCTASDAGGLQNAGDASFSLSTSVAAGTETATAQTNSHQVCDTDSNCSTAGPYTFQVDKKAPVVSCGSADGQWHGADASVNCTASDGGSGLANPADASFSLSTSVAAGTETSNASTGTRNVADGVGHSTTAGPISGNMVDKKDPVVTCGAADGAWHAADVSVGCTAADGGSGLATSGDANFNLSTNVPNGTETSNALTGSRNVLDAVGNSAAAGPIGGNKVDKKDPTISCGTSDGLWHASDVSINCTASDGGSGLASLADASFSLSTNVPSGTETSDASTGTHGVADAVGNSATGGPITGNMIDKKGPSVNLVCPASPVILGSTASASWTASDGGSGVAAGYESGSIGLATGSVGSKTATATAGTSVDKVSNDSPAATCNYSVIYLWTGFFQPVDNANLNQAKAGSAIPVKFNLGGNQGLVIFAALSPSSSSVVCGTIDENIDQIEETVNAGGSSLTYDNTALQYIYVWKSDKSWAGTCRRLDVKLNDGTTHSAYFKWTK